ncbi:MAG: methylenetetrahydrofolate reductase [NAD(P)H] [Dongiaceae bacterium]
MGSSDTLYLRDLYAGAKPASEVLELKDARISLEFFPPKTPEAEQNLWTTIRNLEQFRPDFVTVTYGAGGTTQAGSFRTLERLRRETTLTPVAHLTAVGASRAAVDQLAEQLWALGIRHIIALRGDMANMAAYVPHPEGYAYAADLIAGLKKVAPFSIAAAAYPESHPEAESGDADIDNLKRKEDAGAERAITQFFFEPIVFLKFLEKARARGVTIPIIPGIMPVHNFSQIAKFAASCQASIPPYLRDVFLGLDHDPEARRLFAAITAAEQCRLLYTHGVKEFHFYTLNKSDLLVAMFHMLGLNAAGESAVKVHAQA